MLEKGAIKEAIHCKDQFVSHLSLVSKKDGRKTSDQPEGVELSPTLKTFSDGGAPSVKENAGQCNYLIKFALKDANFCVPLNK